MNHVKQVEMSLTDAGETLKFRKCDFFTNRIDYLVHAIHHGQLDPSSNTEDGRGFLHTPSNIIELRSFFGL